MTSVDGMAICWLDTLVAKFLFIQSCSLSNRRLAKALVAVFLAAVGERIAAVASVPMMSTAEVSGTVA